MPIKDLGVPSKPHLLAILDLIDRCVAEASPVYVHCWGGVGRTGTVVGCWLSRNGCAGQAALDRIAELRAGTPDGFKRSPETDRQRALVLDFASEDPPRPESSTMNLVPRPTASVVPCMTPGLPGIDRVDAKEQGTWSMRAPWV